MDSDRLQHGADVYGAVLSLLRRVTRSQEGAAVVCARFCRDYDLAAVFTKPHGDVGAASDWRASVRHLLSADDDFCAAQPAVALYHLRHRRLFDGHPVWDLDRGAAGSVVHRASVVALDLLDLSSAGGADDAVHLSSNTAPAGANR